MLLGIVTVGILMAAKYVDSVATDAQARAGDFTPIDGVANSRVSRTGAFSAHVTLGSEASHQVITCSEERDDRTLRDGFLNGLQILCPGM